MTYKRALECSHIGDCYDDCQNAIKASRALKAQFSKIRVEDIQAELKEYGAWSDSELQNQQENQIRVVWLAACQIREEH